MILKKLLKEIFYTPSPRIVDQQEIFVKSNKDLVLILKNEEISRHNGQPIVTELLDSLVSVDKKGKD